MDLGDEEENLDSLVLECIKPTLRQGTYFLLFWIVLLKPLSIRTYSHVSPYLII